MPLISDYLFRKASARKIPLQGAFELSPVCNFSCKMCYLRKTLEQIAQSGKKAEGLERVAGSCGTVPEGGNALSSSDGRRTISVSTFSRIIHGTS